MGDALVPVALGTSRTAVSISTRGDQACAILDNAGLKCWGLVDYSWLLWDPNVIGDEPGEMGDALADVDLGANLRVLAVALGEYHTCALLAGDGDSSSSGGEVKCWGNNVNGQLGYGDRQTRGDDENEMGDQLRAVDLGLPATVAVSDVQCGSYHTCALLTTGEGTASYIHIFCRSQDRQPASLDSI